LATGRIDFNGTVSSGPSPRSDALKEIEPEVLDAEEERYQPLSDEFPYTTDEARLPSGTTVYRHTRLLSDEEYGEAASAIRKAQRAPKKNSGT
jgi:hypothetical protein